MHHLKQIITNKNNKLIILRFSLGVIFFFFGILKFIPHASPAEDLAQETIHNLTKGLISKHTGLLILASVETSLGILFILGRFLKIAISIALLHMLFTFLPLFLFSNTAYANQPFMFTIPVHYEKYSFYKCSLAFMADRGELN